MTRYAHLDPGSFFLPGGPAGVLLLHGYTGSPPEMRLIGDYLNAAGLTVYAPLLPGHGTSLADLSTRSWQEWARTAEAGLSFLQARCKVVFAGGLSMGALLTLYLAVRHPELAGAIAYSPAVRTRDWRIYLTPVVKYVLPPQPRGTGSDLADPEAEKRLWGYEADSPRAVHEVLKLARLVQRLLPQVRCPLLVVYSTGDQAIHSTAGPYTYRYAGSADKQLLVLHGSGHALTVDREWQEVAEQSLAFMRERGA